MAETGPSTGGAPDTRPVGDVPTAPDTRPAISVVIATRDRPGLLERAVECVFAQDYAGPVECIVVYDHVPVRELAVPARPGRTLRLVSNEHRPGLPGGRNTGCDLATGELVAFLDDDDRWLPAKLDRQVAVLTAEETVGAVVCGISVVGPGGTAERTGRSTPITLDDLLADRVTEAHPSTLLVRASTIGEAGPVDEDIPGGYAEDYDWLLRIARLGPIASVPEALVIVDWHGGSFFFAKWLMIVDALRYLLRKYPEFARSRRGSARIHGQIAFALAAAGQRRAAARELWTTARLNPTEKRIGAVAPVLLGVASGERVLRAAQRRGRGI